MFGIVLPPVFCLTRFSFDLDLPIECDDEYWDNPNPELRFKQPEGKPSLITAFALTIRFNQIMEITIRTIVRACHFDEVFIYNINRILSDELVLNRQNESPYGNGT